MGEGGTVLFVDDDESQRMLARMVIGRTLRERARLVIVEDAWAARAALEEARRDDSPVLVFSDHHMPGETGLEFARHAKRAHAQRVRFVLLADSARIPPQPDGGPDLIVEKPLNLGQYRALLERLVGEWLESF